MELDSSLVAAGNKDDASGSDSHALDSPKSRKGSRRSSALSELAESGTSSPRDKDSLPKVERRISLFAIPNASVCLEGDMRDDVLESWSEPKTDTAWGELVVESERERKKRIKLKPVQVENIGERAAILSFFPKEEEFLLVPLECIRIEPGETELVWPKEKIKSFRVVIKVPAVNQAHPWDEDDLVIVKMRRGMVYSVQVNDPGPESCGVEMPESNEENPLDAVVQAVQSGMQNLVENQQDSQIKLDGMDQESGLDGAQNERVELSNLDGSQDNKESMMPTRSGERSDEEDVLTKSGNLEEINDGKHHEVICPDGAALVAESVYLLGEIADNVLESWSEPKTEEHWGELVVESEIDRKKRIKLKPIQIENGGEWPAILSFFPKEEEFLWIPLECIRIEPGATELVWLKEKIKSFKVVIKVPAVNQAHPWHEDDLVIVKMRRGLIYSVRVAEPDPVSPRAQMPDSNEENPLDAVMQAVQSSMQNLVENQQDWQLKLDGMDQEPGLDGAQNERVELSNLDGSQDNEESMMSLWSSERSDEDARSPTLHVDDVLTKDGKSLPLLCCANLGDTMPPSFELLASDGTNLSFNTSDINDGKHHEVISRDGASLVAELIPSSRQWCGIPSAPQIQHFALMSQSFMLGSCFAFLLKYTLKFGPSVAGAVILVSLLLVFNSGIRCMLLEHIERREKGCADPYILELKSVTSVTTRPNGAKDNSVAFKVAATKQLSSMSASVVKVLNFSGTWELDLEKSDDPAPYLEALGASWLEQNLMRRVRRTILIDHVDSVWRETITCSLITKKMEMALDGSEQSEVNPFDGSRVAMNSFVDEDGQCVVTKRVYLKKRSCARDKKASSEQRDHIQNHPPFDFVFWGSIIEQHHVS